MNVESQVSNAGLVVVFLGDLNNGEYIAAQIRSASSLPAQGRCLAIIWDPGATLPAPAAIESLATHILLGHPSERVMHSDNEEGDSRSWVLFGTIAIRLIEPGVENASGYRSALIFRCVGPKAYERRKVVEQSVLEQSAINVGHKAFTRDVANNTWHFTPELCDDAIAKRLAYLLTWSDEYTTVLSNGETATFKRVDLDLNKDLIPVPTKRAYYREPTLLGDELS